MQGSRVNRVTLSCGRFRVVKEMAEMRVAAFGANLSALHIVRCVQSLDQEIFRDRFTKCGHADLTVEFVEGSKEWLASNDIHVDACAVVVPEIILERRLRAVLPHHEIFLSL